MHAPASQFYEFGDFRLDPAKRLLRRADGEKVPLTPRVFDTLLFLVEHADTVLDKERIMEAVWPDSIVEENNLTQNISTLRRVFGDTPGSRRFIATVPGRGYRFVAGVKTTFAAAEELSSNGSNGHVAITAEPEPIRLISTRTTAASPSRWSRTRLLTLPIAAIIVVAIAMLWWRNSPRDDLVRTSDISSKSIAVLPFENLSDAKENSYFAAAVQDEILTNLAQSPDLKVISRISANSFTPAQQRNARQIAQKLRVAYLLEGSVQHIGERLRVHAQLIDGRSDSHVWAQTYDRQVADLLSIQDEIATAIATQLGARLVPSAIDAGTAQPTQNTQAYLLYLRARQLELARGIADEVVEIYRKAIAADPGFALARARFALFLMQVKPGSADPALSSEARANATEALRLQPNLGEAHLALTNCYLYLDNDVDGASAELARARQLLPNSAEVPLTAAFIYKRQNRFRDRLVALRRAEALDPLNVQVRSFLVLTLRWLREWQQAIDAVDQRAIFGDEPGEFVSAWARASDEFRLTGNIEALKKAVSEDARPRFGVPAALLNFEQYQVAMFERDYPRAGHFLDQISPAEFSDKLRMLAGHFKETHEVFVAVASDADPAMKSDVFSRAQSATATTPAVGRINPVTDRALVAALRGAKDEAIHDLQVLIAQSNSSQSAIEQNDKLCALAAVYARVGETDKALDLIEHLLTVPVELQRGAVYNMTVTDLKWCWIWDPLRGNPRFQKLLAGPEPKTVY